MPFVDYPFNIGRPYIVVEVKNPLNNIAVVTFALIDTGADSCMFPASIAKAIGIDLKNTKHTGSTKGVENITQMTYRHPIVISLLNPKDRKTVIRVMPQCLIDFTEKEIPPLLGTSNFMQYFTLTITYRSKNTQLVF